MTDQPVDNSDYESSDSEELDPSDNPELQDLDQDSDEYEAEFNEEEEFWNSNGRLLTLDEFANVHLIKMNGSGGAWLDAHRRR